jgi:hypothetical protein
MGGTLAGRIRDERLGEQPAQHAILPVVGDPRALHLASPAELKRRLEADRAGAAYLLYGETSVADDDRNGSGDLFYLRRGNSGGWATLMDVRTGTIWQGEGQSGRYGEQYPGPSGTWWKSQGNYQATVGPPTNPSGAYNLAIAFARQGYVYY